jgi:hypothetical protein
VFKNGFAERGERSTPSQVNGFRFTRCLMKDAATRFAGTFSGAILSRSPRSMFFYRAAALPDDSDEDHHS